MRGNSPMNMHQQRWRKLSLGRQILNLLELRERASFLFCLQFSSPPSSIGFRLSSTDVWATSSTWGGPTTSPMQTCEREPTRNLPAKTPRSCWQCNQTSPGLEPTGEAQGGDTQTDVEVGPQRGGGRRDDMDHVTRDVHNQIHWRGVVVGGKQDLED